MSQHFNGIRKESIKIFIHSAELKAAISWIAYGMLSARNTTVRLAKKQNTMSYWNLKEKAYRKITFTPATIMCLFS